MRNLHMALRKNSHLKHFGRLQYTLFLKGIGLTLEDCLIFWRQAFKLITDDTFNKEYRYNVRHAYGDVGGDAIRRGRGYTPYSCQKILTEHPPGSGDSHGCPYRHFSVDNLTTLLQTTGVNDIDVLRRVKEDVDKQRYHIACNRVFEWAHKGMYPDKSRILDACLVVDSTMTSVVSTLDSSAIVVADIETCTGDIKRVKDDGTWAAADLDTIVHPNTYFKRSYLLKLNATPHSAANRKEEMEM